MERKRTLTQSRRLGNNRRWGAAYRQGRHGVFALEASADSAETAPAVIDLARHRERARS